MEPDELSDLLLAAMLSAADEGTCRYVAGALATGRRYYEECAKGSLNREKLREENERTIRNFVRALRQRSRAVVIDPGRLRVEGWTGAEHGRFFLRVIDQVCNEVVFMDGWEFSSGATKEFVFAKKRGVRCLNEKDNEIPIQEGRQLIADAANYVLKLGQPAGVFERRLNDIDSLEL